MYNILAKSSISTQDSFQKENVFNHIKPISSKSEIFHPNYKEFISPSFLRRLSPIIKMGLTTAKDCLSQINKPFDAIIVGTGLGCLKDTEKFLINLLSNSKGIISPTAFILSTHNTIGGQISLSMKNHSYNVTHTQNNISFEISLIDAMMQVNEGKKNVLVGGCDEYIPFLSSLKPILIPEKYPYKSGASFFVVGSNSKTNVVNVVDVKVYFNVVNIKDEITIFLENQNLKINEIDIVFHSDLNSTLINDFNKQLNYLKYTGFNFSASSFAMYMAIDYIQNNKKSKSLVVNFHCGQLGLILLT